MLFEFDFPGTAVFDYTRDQATPGDVARGQVGVILLGDHAHFLFLDQPHGVDNYLSYVVPRGDVATALTGIYTGNPGFRMHADGAVFHIEAATRTGDMTARMWSCDLRGLLHDVQQAVAS